MSDKSKSLVEKAKNVLDVNKDGVFNIEDVKDSRFWKYILVTLVSIAAPALFQLLIEWIVGETVDFNPFIEFIKFMVGPFILGLLFKAGFDDYDKRLKNKDSLLLEKEKIISEKDAEIHQLAMGLELKKQEINFITKYKIQPKE